MPFQVPTKDKKFVQSNKSDVFGNLWATFNMDFDSVRGRVRVARRLRINTDNTAGGGDTDLARPTGFVRSAASGTDQWWALCGYLFKTAGTDPSAAFAQDVLTNTPTGNTS